MEKPDKNDATVLLRLPADLKAALQREAFVSGRRITAEINIRLKASLESNSTPKSYAASRAPLVVHTTEPSVDKLALSDLDQAILSAFRALSPEKQLGLLSLLK